MKIYLGRIDRNRVESVWLHPIKIDHSGGSRGLQDSRFGLNKFRIKISATVPFNCVKSDVDPVEFVQGVKLLEHSKIEIGLHVKNTFRPILAENDHEITLLDEHRVIRGSGRTHVRQ